MLAFYCPKWVVIFKRDNGFIEVFHHLAPNFLNLGQHKAKVHPNPSPK